MKAVITNAGWAPERKATTERLLGQLSGVNTAVLVSERREHASIWARRMWEWAARQEDHVVCLNDDVLVHPDFVSACRAIIQAVPHEIVSLHTQAPQATELGHRGFHWARCYWLTGPAYILPPGAARALLDYALPWHFISRVNEDNVAIHWAWDKQRPIWNTIPALAHHDVKTPSTLGYDNHPFRTPSVPFDMFPDADVKSVAYWKTTSDPPWIANPWMPPHKLDYMRRVFRAGRPMCFVCVEKEGEIQRSHDGPAICRRCLQNFSLSSEMTE